MSSIAPHEVPAQHELWAACPLFLPGLVCVQAILPKLELGREPWNSLVLILNLWQIGKFRIREMTAHVPYTTLLLRYCVEWCYQGSWAMFPSPWHCSHSCRTLMGWLHTQLQSDPWLALTQASVTRLAALCVDPGYCNLIRCKGSSQSSPKSQPATTRCLWPIPLPEPGNEISFGEHRIQGWEILSSNPSDLWVFEEGTWVLLWATV